MKIIDLSQTIVDQMQVYPGDAPTGLKQTHTLEANNYCNSRLDIGMHNGTHIDGPQHMIALDRNIAQVPLDCFIGTACAIDISRYDVFDDTEIVAAKAKACSSVLFYTGMGKHFGTAQYTPEAPYVSVRVASQLAKMGVKLFGIDAFGPDPDPYLTHHELFKNGILVAENLTNIDLLLEYEQFELIALPLKIEADSAPARIVAVIR